MLLERKTWYSHHVFVLSTNNQLPSETVEKGVGWKGTRDSTRYGSIDRYIALTINSPSFNSPRFVGMFLKFECVAFLDVSVCLALRKYHRIVRGHLQPRSLQTKTKCSNKMFVECCRENCRDERVSRDGSYVLSVIVTARTRGFDFCAVFMGSR